MKGLKRPRLEVPPALVDLFYDLRDRRLLPLAALVVTAIVAVPFLLADSGSHLAAPTPPATASAAASGAGTARLAVVKANPGLRAPGKRLAHLRPKDPFKQHYTSPVIKPGAEPISRTKTSTGPIRPPSSAGAAGSTQTPSPSPSKSPRSSNSGGSGGGSPSGEPQPPHTTLYAFAVDVKISRAEGSGKRKEQAEPETRDKVLPPTSLPSEKAQVITYMGISPKSKKPMFLVSTDVKAVFGEGKCVAGSSSCQLLEIEPGFPEVFVYGENETRYKLTVLKVEPVMAGHS